MKKKLLCLLMPVCLLGLAACQNSTADNNTTNNTEVVTETQTETETEKETKITKNREIYNSDITYETLVRYPDKNINSALKFSGTVTDIVETGEDGMYSVILAVDNNYKQKIVVAYSDDVIDWKILEDDKITIYGGYGGEYALNSSFGYSVKLPMVFATIIDLDK